MSEWSYVIGAYALTWVAIAGYALRLAYRLRRAAEEVAEAERQGDIERKA